ncbi:sensor histidine kinase [Kitasatospora sp. NPDC058965]|uniref:sensor histidine kinase n=1 Tax=Kitasatospora sp. NPDC058965 TaxID=3346682 RepID=UPI0036CAE6A0
MNLRRQIAAMVAVVSLLLALTLGLLVHRAEVGQHVAQARSAAAAALDVQLDTYDRTGDIPQAWAGRARTWTVGAVPGETAGGPGSAGDPPPLPPALLRLAVQGHRGSMLAPGPGAQPVTVMWAAAGDGHGRVFAVWLDYTEDQRAITQLDRTILVSAVLSVLVTVLAGAFAAHRISGRLRTAAGIARTIAGGDLDARIGPLGRPRDEVAELAAAVDSMSAVLRTKLANEQRFTADVAHELRTPLTGLLTAAELLPPGRPTELVQDRVRLLRRLTEDLLEVSRLDAGAETPDLSVVPLGALVTGIVRTAGPGVELRIDDDAQVTTDPRRLDRVLANLVTNALRHGAPPVRVEVAGSTVTVRDHGPGYPPEVLHDGPQRFRTGARERGHGHGLGLTIAQGHAAAIGVELVLRNAPTGGAVAELRLPAVDG